MLSAVVITKNEEKNIKGCIKQLQFCDEIIIIDDFSQDNTIKISKEYKVSIHQKKLENNFSNLRNFGLSKTNGDWILFVDADERITDDLAREIKYKINNSGNKYNGFYLKRKDKFLDRRLNFGETASVKLLRLAKKQTGIWEGKIHEVWKVLGNIGQLQNPIIHERNLSTSLFLQKINKYSTIRAEELYKKGAKTNIFLIFIHPLAKFLYNYILKLGFLDGIPGFIMAGMMSLHSFMVRSKLWVMNKNQGKEEFDAASQKYTE